tara:strand:- start:17190 stop:18413 length:1224 start_codon:yes stop_codon:yes gene_type:complete
MSETTVIIGGGQAGAQTVMSLRREGFEGKIVLIADEPELPYQRPPLSKAYLAGEMAKDRLFIKPAAFYDKLDAELLLGVAVESIDTQKQQLTLKDGSTQSYDQLVFATGGRVRRLTCSGADHPAVHYLRTLGDVEAMQARFSAGTRLAVVGGGYIGLETAAIAAKHGLQVTVLEAQATPLVRVACPEVGQFFQSIHQQAGVSIHCDTLLKSIEDEGEGVAALITNTGERILAELVVVGIGLLPNVELAASAGIACDNGITVDEHCRTSVANIYAAGDCTNHPNPIYQRRMRLESVHNAIEQGKTVAANICGKNTPYAQVPWFWSDQYDVKLQTVGINMGYDQTVIRGQPDSRSFAVFYLQAGRLLAVDAINRPAEFVVAKKIITQGLAVSVDRLQDETINAKELVEA